MSTSMAGSKDVGGIGIISSKKEDVDSSLRIGCLLPSATEICGLLGLAEHVKGITHECDTLYVPNPFTLYDPGQTVGQALTDKNLFTLTTSEIDCHSLDQGTIDQMVKDSLVQQLSLYTIEQEVLKESVQPTLIITQSLCDVCAPSMDNVQAAVAAATGAVCARRTTESKAEEDTTQDNPPTTTSSIDIISLEPTTLLEVADTFVTVAEACGVKERGVQLQTEFVTNLQLLQSTVTQHRGNQKRPTLLLLEWLDPPFDGGHWIPEMISYAGCDIATVNVASSDTPHGKDTQTQTQSQTQSLASKYNAHKSKEMIWDHIYKLDPDCVLIACCGFETARNVLDAKRLQDKLSKLRAFQEDRIYACNGNMYTARPGPSLLNGCAIMACIAFDTVDDDLVTKLKALPFTPPNNGDHAAYEKVVFDDASKQMIFSRSISNGAGIPDMEDLVTEQDVPDFYTAHQQACQENKLFYDDPETGFKVFTELAHKKRGKCCGSGCRHCPYSHENVKDKTSRIQQPALLHEEWDQDVLFSLPKDKNKPIKVLFNSGGKDSFLTMRALARQCQDASEPPFSLILLTTFDATSRIIAHQEFSIDTVVQQAEHLRISLVGVPVHRASHETYVERIQRALTVIEKKTGQYPAALVFGDLHLETIRNWRDTMLGKAFPKLQLEYPLWKADYEKLLTDLESSRVVPLLSASTNDRVQVGTRFTREFVEKIKKENDDIDAFGENGEFHSSAESWLVSRELALALHPQSQ